MFLNNIIELIFGLVKIIIFIPYIVIAFGAMLYLWFRVFIWVRRPMKNICDQYYGGDSDDIPNIGGPYIVFIVALLISFVMIMIFFFLVGKILDNFAVFLLFIYGIYLIVKKVKSSHEKNIY